MERRIFPEEREMLDTAASMTMERVAGLVRAILAGQGSSVEVKADDRLVDAGLTSMDMVNLMLAVEAEFDILIPSSEITPGNFRTVATIETMVERVARADAA